jgi:hypothetical protein
MLSGARSMTTNSIKIIIGLIVLALIGLYSAKVGYRFGSDLAENGQS